MILLVAAAAHRGADHAAPRPLPRRALLRHPGRRLGGALAALLLDLRPPRGLRPDPARASPSRRRSSRCSRARRSSATRSWWRRRSSIGFISLERLGAPHVHRRHDAGAATPSSRSRRCSSRVPTGIKIFNWLGTMWGGKIRFATPMLFCIGFLFQFLSAGLTGRHARGRRRSTGSSATRTSSSRTSTTC